MDENSLAHTGWDCKYHIVFSPKYRRKEICGKLKSEIGLILRESSGRKEVRIIEAHACIDHYICWWKYHLNLRYQVLWDT